jgi:Heterodisulfide reductase, subunit A and related polyferredoxins
MFMKPILVVGGGISGITAAIESAEMEADVILVESSPTLGGRVAQLRHYFPKLCPPTCGLEINYKRVKARGIL